MYCPNCGTELPGTAKTCPRCATVIGVNQPDNRQMSCAVPERKNDPSDVQQIIRGKGQYQQIRRNPVAAVVELIDGKTLRVTEEVPENNGGRSATRIAFGLLGQAIYDTIHDSDRKVLCLIDLDDIQVITPLNAQYRRRFPLGWQIAETSGFSFFLSMKEDIGNAVREGLERRWGGPANPWMKPFCPKYRCDNCGLQLAGCYGYCPQCGKPGGMVDLTGGEGTGAGSISGVNSAAGSSVTALRPKTTISDRYVIEKMLGNGEFGITYSAMDRKTGKRVALIEYYPCDAAARDSGGIALSPLYPSKKEKFESGKAEFLEDAKSLPYLGETGYYARILDVFDRNGTAYCVSELLENVPLKEYIPNAFY